MPRRRDSAFQFSKYLDRSALGAYLVWFNWEFAISCEFLVLNFEARITLKVIESVRSDLYFIVKVGLLPDMNLRSVTFLRRMIPLSIVG